MAIKLGNLVLYSVLELSEKLDITAATIRSYLKSGKLRGQNMGTSWYVSEENLKAFFNGSPTDVAPPAAESAAQPGESG